MTAPRLLDGLAFGESPRWHDGRLWLADRGAGEVLTVDEAGRTEVAARVDGLPICFDWLPDGRLLVVAGRAGRLLRQEPDGRLHPHAVWYGDVPNRCAVRVAEGGRVLHRVELDRGCFACELGGPASGVGELLPTMVSLEVTVHPPQDRRAVPWR